MFLRSPQASIAYLIKVSKKICWHIILGDGWCLKRADFRVVLRDVTGFCLAVCCSLLRFYYVKVGTEAVL